MLKANKTGQILEDKIYECLCKFTGIKVDKQFPLKDIFGQSKVDFRVEYLGNTFFIESKNQTVSGSVDQKLPFYIENIRENVYPGHFVFVINGEGIRKGAMDYLKRKQETLNFSIIDFKMIDHQFDKLFNHNQSQTIAHKLTPIIKWAGGKRGIMNNIRDLFPQKISGNYFEPFCGGISVACELYNTGRLDPNCVVYLNDNIPQLITLYKMIKEHPYLLIKELEKGKYIITEENFIINKERYNSGKDIQEIEIAALFLFLNKSGYNGVYRENKQGIYNVPFCKKEGGQLYDRQNLLHMSEFLGRCRLSCEDYTQVLSLSAMGDTVYFDPPYHKTFNSYSKAKFDENNHIELREATKALKQEGIDVFVSNSDTEFVRNLYSGCVLHEIEVKRVVNADASARKTPAKELFIYA